MRNVDCSPGPDAQLDPDLELAHGGTDSGTDLTESHATSPELVWEHQEGDLSTTEVRSGRWHVVPVGENECWLLDAGRFLASRPTSQAAQDLARWLTLELSR